MYVSRVTWAQTNNYLQGFENIYRGVGDSISAADWRGRAGPCHGLAGVQPHLSIVRAGREIICKSSRCGQPPSARRTNGDGTPSFARKSEGWGTRQPRLLTDLVVSLFIR